jgi:hypothetical protein
MKTLKWIIALALLAAVPVFISNLSEFGEDLKSEKGLYPFLFWLSNNKIWILPLLAILAISIPSIKVLRSESKVKNSVVKKLLQTLLTDVFNNDWENTRVTIFREASWWKIFWIWLKDTFWNPIVFLRRKGTHKFPNPISDKFIISTARAGTENPSPQTYFRFVERTAVECEGIASYAKQINRDNRREVLIDNLPDINDFDLSDVSLLTDDQREVLRTYMDATHIKDVGALQRLHRKAKHFFAIALTDDKLDSKAILVVDSVTDVSPFDDNTKAQVAGYIKIFSTTF